MANEYKLRTIKDIWDKVPADRIEDCMKELTQLMVTSRAMAGLIRDIAQDKISEELPEQIFVFPEEITWIDDGKGELTSKFADVISVTYKKADGPAEASPCPK